MNIPENFSRWMFDYKEGNLSASEMEVFERFLAQNSQYEVEVDAWNDAFIKNENFVYPNAASLEKDNRIIAGWYTWGPAAIGLVLITTSLLFLTQNDSNRVDEVLLNNEEGDYYNVLRTQVSEPDFDDNRDILVEEISTLEGGSWGNIGTENGNSQSNGIGQDMVNFGLDYESHLNELTTTNSLFNPMALNSENLDNMPAQTNPTVSKESIEQEFTKYQNENHSSAYQGNPDLKDLGFDVTKKNHYDHGLWHNKMKRFFTKVKKAFDVPPTNLTNLGDPEILLPNTSVLAFNPGFVGGLSGSRFEMNYRNQWLGSEQNSQQMTMSFDKYVPEMRGGIGIILNAKDYGFGNFGDYNVSLAYSPKVLFGRNVVFEPAVKMTLGVMNANGDKLAPGGQLEMDRGRIISIPTAQQMSGNQQRLWYKDYGLGFVLNAKKFYAGFSADNLNDHYESVYNIEGFTAPTSSPIRYNAIAGFDFDKDLSSGRKPFSASPFVAYQQYGDKKEIWGGVNFIFSHISVGGSVAQTWDFTASLGMKFEKFKLVYHYDRSRSHLTDQRLGSHNISMRFNGSNKSKRRIEGIK